MNNQDRIEAVANQFGFTTRKVIRGYFIAPVTRNRFGHIHIGSDQMLISPDGEITVYDDCAQAFVAARAVSLAIQNR